MGYHEIIEDQIEAAIDNKNFKNSDERIFIGVGNKDLWVKMFEKMDVSKIYDNFKKISVHENREEDKSGPVDIYEILTLQNQLFSYGNMNQKHHFDCKKCGWIHSGGDQMCRIALPPNKIFSAL